MAKPKHRAGGTVDDFKRDIDGELSRVNNPRPRGFTSGSAFRESLRGEAHKPRMRDPVSGSLMKKGRPVETAYSRRPPDDGPLPREITRQVPRVKGFGSTAYTPNKAKPWLRRFKGSPTNDQYGVTGRVVNPSGPGLALDSRSPDPARAAMRRGRPISPVYDGSVGSKVAQAARQFGDAYEMGRKELIGRQKRKR